MRTFLADIYSYISQIGIDPTKGLGKELFLLVSSLTPIVNVDLLVYNRKGQFLLVKRNDSHCGKGWHVPGGCVRFKETFADRIKTVARQELGICNIQFEETPLKVFEIIESAARQIENQNERAHFITIVYRCSVDDTYVIDNGNKTEADAGYIKWFDKLPNDLLRIQECYKTILD